MVHQIREAYAQGNFWDWVWYQKLEKDEKNFAV